MRRKSRRQLARVSKNRQLHLAMLPRNAPLLLQDY
jgi:hypothetical protein